MELQQTSKVFPGFDKVYVFGISGSNVHFHADLDMEFDNYFECIRGELTPPKDLTARWAMGRALPGDIVGTTLAVPMVISERVVKLLTDNGFTGWSAPPCLVIDKFQNVHNYHLLSVHGRCGPIDPSKSVEFQKTYPGRVSSAWRGLFFDPQSWDGSDLFMESGKTNFTFMTERTL